MSTSVKIPVSVLLTAVAVAAAALAVLVTVLVTRESPSEQGAPSFTTLDASFVETTLAQAVETTVVATTTTSEPALAVDEASSTETKPLPVFDPMLVDSAYGCLQDLLDRADAYFEKADNPEVLLGGPSNFGNEGPKIDGGWCDILETDAAELRDINVRSAFNRLRAAEPSQAFGLAMYLLENGEPVDRASLLRQARAFEDAVFRFADELAELGLELP